MQREHADHGLLHGIVPASVGGLEARAELDLRVSLDLERGRVPLQRTHDRAVLNHADDGAQVHALLEELANRG